MLLPLQGVNAMIIRVTQGVASLALGYELLGFQPVVHYRLKNHAENGGFCRTAANFMQKLCKVSAMKFTSIAEPQPILCKDKVFLLKKALLFLQT